MSFRRVLRAARWSLLLLAVLWLLNHCTSTLLLRHFERTASSFDLEWEAATADAIRGVVASQVRTNLSGDGWSADVQADVLRIPTASALGALWKGNEIPVVVEDARVRFTRDSTTTETEMVPRSAVQSPRRRTGRVQVDRVEVSGIFPGTAIVASSAQIVRGPDGLEFIADEFLSQRVQAEDVRVVHTHEPPGSSRRESLEFSASGVRVYPHGEQLDLGRVQGRAVPLSGMVPARPVLVGGVITLDIGECRSLVAASRFGPASTSRHRLLLQAKLPQQSLDTCVEALPRESISLLGDLRPSGTVEADFWLVATIRGSLWSPVGVQLDRLAGPGIRTHALHLPRQSDHAVATLLREGGEVHWRSPTDGERRTLVIPLADVRGRPSGEEVSEHQGRWVRWTELPEAFRSLLLAGEDPSMGSHPGVDLARYERILELSLRDGRVVAGGSTIAMQLARNLHVGMERTVARKLAEMVVALVLTSQHDAEELLEAYINVAEWGDGLHGIDAAARHHLGTEVGALTLLQSAWLVSILPAPIELGVLAPDGTVRDEHRWRVEELLLRWMNGWGEWSDEVQTLREALRLGNALQVRLPEAP